MTRLGQASAGVRALDLGSLLLSLGLHAAVALGALLVWRSWDAAAERVVHHRHAPIPISLVVTEVQLPGVSSHLLEPKPPDEPPPLGGGQRRAAPDTTMVGRGGPEGGSDAPQNLADTLASRSLTRETQNHTGENQVQRVSTAESRASDRNRRVTSQPMQLSFVMSGPRRPSPRRSVASKVPPTTSDQQRVASATTGGEIVELSSLPLADQKRLPLDAQRVARVSVRADLGFARPRVARARDSVPAAHRDRPRDDRQSDQSVANAVQSLVTTSTLASAGRERGAARSGPGRGAESGPRHGARSEAIQGPAASAHSQGEPAQQRYLSSVQRALDAIDLNGLYPDWAKLQGRGGLVILRLSIAGSGPPSACAIQRASGIDEFDHRVRDAVCSLSLPVPPPSLGASFPLLLRFDAINPAVGVPR